jgi:hypothetical protein
MRAFIAEEFREPCVEVYEADPEPCLVTCIEVLSLANKRRGSEGWNLYHQKRQELLLGAANFIEIDLLRGGERMPMLDPWPNSPYTLLVCRRERAPYCRVWPAHFQRPLPNIPVPLASPEPDVTLNLQSLIEEIYTCSRYHRRAPAGVRGERGTLVPCCGKEQGTNVPRSPRAHTAPLAPC